MQFINQEVQGMDDAENELFLWMLTQIRMEASPIYGWPLSVVKAAAANRLKPGEGAVREYSILLLCQDMKDAIPTPLSLLTMLLFSNM